MEKMRLTIWGKVLIGVVLLGIAWAVLQDRREPARIQQLASLPPCRLAAEYLKWRLDFDDLHPEDEITGPVAENFVNESEVFEQAARSARRVSQDRLLQKLEALTAIDSRRSVYEKADTAPFIEVMISKCPNEVEGLISGSKR